MLRHARPVQTNLYVLTTVVVICVTLNILLFFAIRALQLKNQYANAGETKQMVESYRKINDAQQRLVRDVELNETLDLRNKENAEKLRQRNKSQRERLLGLKNRLEAIGRQREILFGRVTSLENTMNKVQGSTIGAKTTTEVVGSTTTTTTTNEDTGRRLTRSLQACTNDTTHGKIVMEQITNELKFLETDATIRTNRRRKRQASEETKRYIDSFKTYVPDNPNITSRYCT